MTCSQLSPPISRRLTCDSTVTQYAPLTGWMPCTGLDSVRAVIRNSAVTSSFQSRLAVQFASVRTDNPGDWIDMDQWLVGAGDLCTGDDSLPSQADTAFFVRFGVGYVRPSGSGTAGADVSVQLSFQACGNVVGNARFHAVVSGDDGPYYMPISDWFPLQHATSVRAAAVVSGVSGGTFNWRLTLQTATTEVEQAGAWSDSFQATDYSGGGETNTGDVQISNTTDMWGRFGVRFGRSGGSSLTQADIQVTCAIK